MEVKKVFFEKIKNFHLFLKKNNFLQNKESQKDLYSKVQKIAKDRRDESCRMKNSLYKKSPSIHKIRLVCEHSVGIKGFRPI